MWIEGEDPERHTFQKHSWYDDVRKEALSGRDWLSHYGPEPGEASYHFRVAREGRYSVWARLNDLLVSQRCRIDGGEWKTCDLEADPRERITISPRPDHRRIAWHRIAVADLAEGEHRLESTPAAARAATASSRGR